MARSYSSTFFIGPLRTGLYGATSWQFIQNFINVMGTESGRRALGRSSWSCDYMNARIDTNNEVVIEVTGPKGYYSYHHNKTIFRKSQDPKIVLQEFAYLIKKYMYYVLGRKFKQMGYVDGQNAFIRKHWTNKNTDEVETLSRIVNEYEYEKLLNDTDIVGHGHQKPSKDFVVTVADVNYVYTVFRNYARGRKTDKFSRKIVERFNGKKFDPLQSEMEECRRQRIKEIMDEYGEKITNTIPEYSAVTRNGENSAAYLELQSIIKAFKAKQEKIKEALILERDAAIKEFTDSLSFMTNI